MASLKALSLTALLTAALCTASCSAGTEQPEPAEESAGLPELRELAGWEIDEEQPGFFELWDLSHHELSSGGSIIEHDDYLRIQGAYLMSLIDLEDPQAGSRPVLNIASSPGSMSYALYGVKYETPGDHLASVCVTGSGEFAEGSGYYIAVSGYGDGRWTMLGPFSETGVYHSVAEIDCVSDAGRTQLALVTFGGDRLMAERIYVQSSIDK